MKQLEITLKRSLIGRRPNQVATAKALGLTKINQSVVKPDNPSVRGMTETIQHLVSIKEV